MSIVGRYRCKVRGKPVEIRFRSKPPKSWGRDQAGLCAIHGEGFLIDIRLDQPDRLVLDTLIHEVLHAAYWDLDEQAVGEAASDITGILWKLGWRYRHDDKRAASGGGG